MQSLRNMCQGVPGAEYQYAARETCLESPLRAVFRLPAVVSPGINPVWEEDSELLEVPSSGYPVEGRAEDPIVTGPPKPATTSPRSAVEWIEGCRLTAESAFDAIPRFVLATHSDDRSSGAGEGEAIRASLITNR